MDEYETTEYMAGKARGTRQNIFGFEASEKSLANTMANSLYDHLKTYDINNAQSIDYVKNLLKYSAFQSLNLPVMALTIYIYDKFSKPTNPTVFKHMLQYDPIINSNIQSISTDQSFKNIDYVKSAILRYYIILTNIYR